ncbi:hypothetical protein J6V86_00135 [bacterium]|nr:hypothetical protein [bacterium]
MLPLVGDRGPSEAIIYGQGRRGSYKSSSPHPSNSSRSCYMNFNDNLNGITACADVDSRSGGHPVRCMKNTQPDNMNIYAK